MDMEELERQAKAKANEQIKCIQENAEKRVERKKISSQPLEKTARVIKYMKHNADSEYADGSFNALRQAFSIYLRIATICIEVLPKHPSYLNTSESVRECKKICISALDTAEELKRKSLRPKFIELFKADIQRKQIAAKNDAASKQVEAHAAAPSLSFQALSKRLEQLTKNNDCRKMAKRAGIIIGSTVRITALGTQKSIRITQDGSVDALGDPDAAESKFVVSTSNGHLQLQNALKRDHCLAVRRISISYDAGGNFSELRISEASGTKDKGILTIAHAHGNGFLGVGPNGVTFILSGDPTDKRGFFRIDPTQPATGEDMLHSSIPAALSTVPYGSKGPRVEQVVAPQGSKLAPAPEPQKLLPYPDLHGQEILHEDLIEMNPTKNLRPLYIPVDTVSRFLQCSAANNARNVETCGYLVGKKKNHALYITALLIPKQSGMADNCEPEDDLDKLNYCIENEVIELGWIHTHPSQTAFLSSVDLHTACGYQSMLPEAVSIVCSIKYKDNKTFSLTRRGMDVIQNCSRSGFHPHEETNLFEESRHVKMENQNPVQVVDWR